MKHFSFLPHTADAGMLVRGATLEEMFIHAAEGLSAYLGAPAGRGRNFTFTVRAEGPDTESLLVAWLNELLRETEVRHSAVTAFAIKELSSCALTASVRARPLLPGERPAREIKAATYCGVSVQKTEKGYCARVIFDV